MFERPPRPTRTATLFPAPTVLPSPMVSRLSILRMPFVRADALPAPVVSAPQMMPPDGFNPLGSGPTEIRERPLCAELCWGDRWCSPDRSEEHTSELQSLMRISYAVFCMKKNTHH